MLTVAQVGNVLTATGVADPKAWARAVREAGANDLGAALTRLARSLPPWWDNVGPAPPGLTSYQREVALAAAFSGTPDTLRASLRLNRYLLLDLLGVGGQGKLFRARQLSPGRYAAVKLLLRDRDTDRERFGREAQVLMQLVHPSVARFYAYERIRDADDHMTDQYLMAMEYVDGTDLEPVVRANGPVPPAAVARWGVQLLEGLDALHRAGFVHRDVKPLNVRVLGYRPGVDLAPLPVKLLDFGLVRPVSEAAAEGRAALTFVGSSEYAPPEQWPGGTLSNATDYYALGGTLYYALTGRSPFALEKHDPMAYFRRHVHDAVPNFPPALGVPRELARVVRKMLAKTPGERGTVEELLAGLQKAGGGKPPETPPRPAFATPRPRKSTPQPAAAGRDEPRGPIDAMLTTLERLLIPGYTAGAGSGVSLGERVVALLIRPPVLIVFLLLAVALVVWWIR